LRYLFTIIFLYCSAIAFGQKMAGRITDKETGEPLFPVLVTNLLTRVSVLSDENGGYSIEAKAGEFVAFTFISYKAQQKKVPASIGTAEVDVQLQSVSILLDEAVINSLTKYQKDSIQRQTLYQRPLAAQRASFMSPVSALAEVFSKKSKQTFRFQKNFYNLETQQFVDSRYTPELVQTLTKLTGDTLAHFMNSFVMPYDYARTATDLELKMWIRSHYREYMKEEKFRQIPAIKDSLITPSH